MKKKDDIMGDRRYVGNGTAEETPERSAVSGGVNVFDKRIWRVRDVAEVLGCSEGHVRNLAHRDEIPRVKKGKFLFFVPEEILEWILKGD